MEFSLPDILYYYGIEGTILLCFVYMLYMWTVETRKLPPGPMGIPILGYIPFLGKEPHKVFLKLSEKYGNIISLRLGPTLTVVLNDDKTLRETLSHTSALDRPAGFFDHLPERGFFSTNGDAWKEQRRFCVQTIKDTGLGKNNWEKFMEEEAQLLVEDLLSYNGTPLYLTRKMSQVAGITILSLLIGRRLDRISDKETVEMIVEFMHYSMVNSGLSNPVSLIPGLRQILEVLHVGEYRKGADTIKAFAYFIKDEIEKQKKSPEDYKGFLSLYIDKIEAMKIQSETHYFTEANMRGNVNVLYLGGSDTVTISMEYLFRYMASHQEIQSLVHKELDEVIGRDGHISYNEREKVPYTMAVLMEVQRAACILNLNVSRCARSAFHIFGYVIPKGTHVVANFYAVHRDAKFWDEPDTFKPERFLTTDRQAVLKNLPSFYPFSAGKRNCPGEKVAWTEMLLLFTTIMQKCHVIAPPGEQISFDAFNGVVSHLKPQRLCFVER